MLQELTYIIKLTYISQTYFLIEAEVILKTYVNNEHNKWNECNKCK